MDNLRGITFRNWWRLLRQNRFAIAGAYWRRAWAVTEKSLQNSAVQPTEDKRFGAAIEQATIQPPLFILGHWRTGTTLLHELLALDTQFAYPSLFEISNPHTFLTVLPKIESELAKAPPMTRWVDNMTITYRSPGEDEYAVAVASLCSPILGWSFPRQEARYDAYYTFRDVLPAEVEAFKAALVWFYRKLTLKYNRPLVLKSPPHTGRIRLLLELFPEARFIHIHREPYTVFRSTQLLHQRALVYSLLQHPSPEGLDAGILRRYAAIYGAYFEQRALIPPGRLVEIRYEDLERDSVGQVQFIYERLGLPGFDRLETKLVDYVHARTNYKKNRHAPLPEPLRAKIAQAWHPYFQVWGYPL
jgi:hypothetical protein